MNILGRLALLFVIVPVVELILLIEIGQLVGLLPTIALVVFTGVTGAWLARAEGLRVFFHARLDRPARYYGTFDAGYRTPESGERLYPYKDELEMGPEPNTSWAIGSESAPYSMSGRRITN